jgi:hypothetical protein
VSRLDVSRNGLSLGSPRLCCAPHVV